MTTHVAIGKTATANDRQIPQRRIVNALGLWWVGVICFFAGAFFALALNYLAK